MEDNPLKKLLSTIGKRIRQQRLKEELQPEDVAEMTGLTAATIRNIEDGNEMLLSNFLAISFAINMHPKDLLDIEMEIRPPYELSQPRKEKSRLTPRIESLILANFFQTERTTSDVVNELQEVYGLNTKTSIVSVILNRKVEEEMLNVSKQGRFNLYKKRKK